MSPFEQMSLEQIQELLEAQSRLETLPGVLYMQPEFKDSRRLESVICVYIDAEQRETVERLPATIGGLPVVAKVENPRTSAVLEVIEVSDGRRDAAL